MIEQAYFLSGFALCAIITLIIILIIHRKLFVLLTDLCEFEERALIWTFAIEVWFFLYSTSAALKWGPLVTSDRQLFFSTINQIKEGLNGMWTALIMLSVGLLVFIMIRKVSGREHEAPRRIES